MGASDVSDDSGRREASPAEAAPAWLWDSARLTALAVQAGVETFNWQRVGEPFEWLRALVDMAHALLGARAVALFDLREHPPRLCASAGLTQLGLDIVRNVRPRQSNVWRRIRRSRKRHTWVLLAWCHDRTRNMPAGVLYVEDPRDDADADGEDRPLLAFLTRRLAQVLCGTDADPLPDISAELAAGGARRHRYDPVALRALMEHHEWNVSAAARALGVTRPTIYNRLERAGVPRQRVRKSRWHRRRGRVTSAPGASETASGTDTGGTDTAPRGHA